MCVIREVVLEESRRFAACADDRKDVRFDDRGAMEVHAIEYKVNVAIALFDLITHTDETWRALVSDGKEEYSAETHGAVKEAYGLWLRSAERLLGDGSAPDERSARMTHAAKLQSYIREARGIMTPDAEFFGEGLVERRNEAIAAHARGETSDYRTEER